MNDDAGNRADDGGDPAQPWWAAGAPVLPDVEALLGPEGMQAVGGVAEEALKLFVVLRDRVNESGLVDPPTAAPGATGGWGPVLGHLASGAVRAVGEFAAAAGQPSAGSTTTPVGAPAAVPGQPAHTVAPGQAAACSYCPICQAIALFRSVPMTTWQRLASSVVDAADAARDFAWTNGSPPSVVITPQAGTPPATGGPLIDFLDDLDDPSGADDRD